MDLLFVAANPVTLRRRTIAFVPLLRLIRLGAVYPSGESFPVKHKQRPRQVRPYLRGLATLELPEHSFSTKRKRAIT